MSCTNKSIIALNSEQEHEHEQFTFLNNKKSRFHESRKLKRFHTLAQKWVGLRPFSPPSLEYTVRYLNISIRKHNIVSCYGIIQISTYQNLIMWTFSRKKLSKEMIYELVISMINKKVWTSILTLCCRKSPALQFCQQQHFS